MVKQLVRRPNRSLCATNLKEHFFFGEVLKSFGVLWNVQFVMMLPGNVTEEDIIMFPGDAPRDRCAGNIYAQQDSREDLKCILWGQYGQQSVL